MLCLSSPPPGSLPCNSPWLQVGFSNFLAVAAQQLEVQEVITGAGLCRYHGVQQG